MSRQIRTFFSTARVILAVFSVALLAGCGGGSTLSGSGIRGVTMRHVVGGAINTTTGQSAINEEVAYPGAIITIQPAGGGTEIARTTSDSNGDFQITLPPGSYLMVPLLPDGTLSSQITDPSSSTVAVTANTYTLETVVYTQDVP